MIFEKDVSTGLKKMLSDTGQKNNLCHIVSESLAPQSPAIIRKIRNLPNKFCDVAKDISTDY